MSLAARQAFGSFWASLRPGPFGGAFVLTQQWALGRRPAGKDQAEAMSWPGARIGAGPAAMVLAALLAGCAGGGEPPVPGVSALSPQAQQGRSTVEERGCLSCHSTDGRAGTGPTWKGLAGSTVTLADGRTVVADRHYLRRSILDPDGEVVSGFPAGLMASVIRPGTLNEAEAEAIVSYLEALR